MADDGESGSDNQFRAARIEKLKALRAMGVDPYPYGFTRTAEAKELEARYASLATGTVTEDTAKAVREVKAGRVEFKLDKNGNVAVPMGKFSFAPAALVENGSAVIDAVVKARPPAAKGKFVHSITVSATMTPGLHLDASTYNR